jgi:hypothetical protein
LYAHGGKIDNASDWFPGVTEQGGGARPPRYALKLHPGFISMHRKSVRNKRQNDLQTIFSANRRAPVPVAKTLPPPSSPRAPLADSVRSPKMTTLPSPLSPEGRGEK